MRTGWQGPFALVGATASGKTALGVRVAQALGEMEIVTADSMQVYRGMDIGTAKPTNAERGGVPHHLLDVAGPDEEWDLQRFLGQAQAVIADIEARGKRALVVGGTGLYLHALVDRFAVPGQWPALAVELGATGTVDLVARLAELDPEAAAKIEPANRRRLLRALEVTLGSGRPFSSFGPGVGTFPATNWRLAGVWLPRAVVAARVKDRFDEMMAAGLVDEARAVAEAVGPGGLSRTAGQALGYREIWSHLDGRCTLDDAVGLAVTRTRQFARRQRVWWRRDPRVRWLGSASDPVAVLPALLGEWSDE